MLVLVVALAGCSQQSAETSTESTTAVAVPTETTTVTPEDASDTALFLEVFTPVEKSTVDTETVSVTGKTSPVAIVSVNGTLLKVAADGTFSTDVQLKPGPNVIQVVASNISGEQVGKVIALGRVE